MWPVTYRFERSSIRSLVEKRLFGRPSLCIVHANPAFPKSVVFQPREFSRLESLLTQNGFLLTGEEADLSTAGPIRYSNVIPAIGFIAAVIGLIAAVIAIGIVASIIWREVSGRGMNSIR
jgi:hypothetical protein